MMSGSAAILVSAIGALALTLQGCGGGGTPTPAPSPPSPPAGPTPAPGPGPTPAPPTPTPYDGNPPFMLEDVGMKAFSYNPLFLNHPNCFDKPGGPGCTAIINDDVSAEWAMNMWSSEGRGDIKTIATFGANAIRLYGNDPRFSKRKFFDELLKNNMKAVTGMSNYPFSHQDSPQGCIWNNKYDCFQRANDGYNDLLTTGEFAKDGYYHNAIEIISIMNEPDINAYNPGNWKGKDNYIKGVLSAFDGILSAEKNAGIKPWKNGKLPKITIAWSYATLPASECSSKGYINDTKTECGPSIGFMAQFYYAIHDSENLVGYTPKNDLKKAYLERFIGAIQPFNPAKEVYTQAILPGQTLASLKNVKMYLGEFNPAINICRDKPICAAYGRKELERDLKEILTDEKWTKNVLGVSFFQFQQPYCKGSAHETAYGMFKMTKQQPWRTGWIQDDPVKDHPINCLEWKTKELGEAVAAAYGGKVPELHCPNATAVADAKKTESEVVV